MQATMLPFPYTLSCPTLMDISTPDSVTASSPSGTPSPPAVSFISRCYESILTTNSVPSLPTTTSVQSFSPEKLFSKQNSFGLLKKSFTIEAILGLNDCKHDEVDLIRPLRTVDNRRQDRLLSTNPYVVPDAATRCALSVVYQSKGKEPKSKSEHLSNMEGLKLPEMKVHPSQTSRTISPINTSTTNGSSMNQKQSSMSAGKAKRIRTIFTPDQLERLEAEFEKQMYMVGPERLYLAAALNLTEAQVKVWFQNRRIKHRKQHLELQQARLAQIRDSERDNDRDMPTLTEDITHSQYDDYHDD